jgi:serine/threonine-protein kinase RsbW
MWMNQVVSEDFTVTGLQRVRTLVKRAAQWVGLATDAIENLVLAVNEIAINAVLHAGGRGHLAIRAWPTGIVVEISDAGPGLPADVSDQRPDVHATHGRGLWLARRLCPDITMINSGHGLTVRLVPPCP